MSDIVKNNMANAIEQVVIGGDLSKLTAEQRVAYVRTVCDSLGVNPATTPFQYIVLNGKLTLYATRSASEQLRKIHGVSIAPLERSMMADAGLYQVVARGKDATGREDEASGVVTISGLKGENLANAMLKCETKAKRRLTLSICGLGFLDETEVSDIPGAQMPTAAPVSVAKPALESGPSPVAKAAGSGLAKLRERVASATVVVQDTPSTSPRKGGGATVSMPESAPASEEAPDDEDGEYVVVTFKYVDRKQTKKGNDYVAAKTADGSRYVCFDENLLDTIEETKGQALRVLVEPGDGGNPDRILEIRSGAASAEQRHVTVSEDEIPF